MYHNELVEMIILTAVVLLNDSDILHMDDCTYMIVCSHNCHM